MNHPNLERRNSSSNLFKNKKGAIGMSVNDAPSNAAMFAAGGSEDTDGVERAVGKAMATESQHESIEEGAVLDQEKPKTTAHMTKNTALCSFCFGMGMSVLFIHVGTTTLAAKEFQSTAAATLPFGEE